MPRFHFAEVCRRLRDRARANARGLGLSVALLALCDDAASAIYSGSFYGLPLNADGLSNLTVGTSAGHEVSYRFRSDHSGVVASARVFLIWDNDSPGYHSGNGGRIRLELFADDGSVAHAPGGAPLSAAQIDDPLNGYFRTVTWTPAVALSAGQRYHLVFRNVDADPATNWVSVDNLYVKRALPHMQPGVSDLDYALLYRWSGVGWRERYYDAPVFQLKFDDGWVLGNGYMGSRVTRESPIAGGFKAREILTPSQSVTPLQQVFVRLKKWGAPGPLQVRLADAADSTLRACEVAAERVGSENAWASCRFATPIVLTGGASYRLELSAPAGDPYLIFGLEDGARAGYGFGTASVFSEGVAGLGWNGSWPSRLSGPLFDSLAIDPQWPALAYWGHLQGHDTRPDLWLSDLRSLMLGWGDYEAYDLPLYFSDGDALFTDGFDP